MRKELKKENGNRMTFVGKVSKFGTKPNWHGFPEKTILLVDVDFQATNKRATDHIWFTVGKRIDALSLQEGDTITFDARVSEYVKGYVNRRNYIDERTTDYKLSNPTKIKVLSTN